MKALEKAAKDREGGEAVTPASTVTAGLSLEPIPENASVTPQPAPAAAASPAARSNTSAEAKPSAKAASVMQAGRDARSSPGILRTRPLFVFSVVAGLVALSYGGYVYLQLTNPALFVKQAPRPPQTAQVNPAPVAPAPTNAAQTPPPLSSLGETEVPRAAPDAATATARKDGSAVAPAIPLPALANAIATAATVAQRTAAAVDLERKGTRTTPGSTASATATAPQISALPLPLPVASDAPRDNIKVTAGAGGPVLNPLLTEAYAALNTGNLDASQRLYNQVLRSEPANIDALLGLAAIATQQGNNEEATRRYLKILELDPRHALAQAALVGMLGRADPQSAETRVKQLIAREPAAAYLHFALGITYVDQKRWPDAQQSFFQAHQLQPDNPDYAFNLAVALEHIGQPKTALNFYRRALQLAALKGQINFSTVTAEERIGKLEKVVR